MNLIDPSVIRTLQKRRDELKQELALIERQLEAAKLLLGSHQQKPEGTRTITDTIIELVAAKPQSNDDLRKALEAAGLSTSSFYNQTSTLSKAKKIKKNKEGLWVKA